MRKLYVNILKKYFHANIIRSRNDLEYTQSQMASLLIMDERSYVDLDHGKTCCSALTLALFLIYCCNDPLAFLNGLREAFEKECENAA